MLLIIEINKTITDFKAADIYFKVRVYFRLNISSKTDAKQIIIDLCINLCPSA